MAAAGGSSTDDPFAGLRAPYVLLEDRLKPAARARLYRDPVAVVCCDDSCGVDQALARIEDALASGLHAAGLFSYEFGYALEPRLAHLMPPRRGTPLFWFGLFDAPQRIAAEALDAAFANLGPPAPITGLRAGHDRVEHVEKVDRILGLIAAGDLYQANLTFPMRFRFAGDPLALYGALRVRQPVAHGGVIHLGGDVVLSVSPELWIDVAEGEATTRPMKGTAARGADPADDRAAMRALAGDPKQRAENLMIADLLRNDLARVSQAGTVRTPALFTVETYPSFHTLTSTVTARLRPGLGLRERLAALFPCGSIVGAPKIRASEVIRTLEPDPRGFYTGALGRMAPNGDMNFNVAIRTAMIGAHGEARYGVGGGIVADSDPGAEYDEALLKARVLSDLAEDFGLIETFRWSSEQGFVRLALHLDRLAGSAAQLGFKLDRRGVERMLAELARSWSGRHDDLRVRLELTRAGAVSVTQDEVAPQRSTPLRIGVTAHRLDPGDGFLRHKTTRRAHFESAFTRATAGGLDEVLFLNRRGEAAEASRNSLFAEIDGRLITPPLSCGVLPGVLRASLIADGTVIEGVLGLADIRRATALFVGNSLHGLRPALLVE